jgi:CDP-diacylglycerol--glycerol-3-phosphate 3-phosphatidyltransferase
LSSPEQAERPKRTYQDEVRRVAGRWVAGLERTPITPDALTIFGVGLCIAGAVVVYFEYVSDWFFILGGALFVVGSVLDILDGALARRSGKGTPFGAFLDSTVDRVGELFMLSAIGLVLMRDGSEWGVALAFAAVGGSFLVSYTRARAEAIGLRADVGFGSRAERVVVISVGLAFAPFGSLPYVVAVLAATAWLTVLQRILFVRNQLLRRS